MRKDNVHYINKKVKTSREIASRDTKAAAFKGCIREKQEYPTH